MRNRALGRWRAAGARCSLKVMWAAPDVFRYRDYRTFLRAFYDHNKQREYGFSLRAFSKRAQLRSSNYLKLVMDGERNLGEAMAPRFALALGLKDDAARYFVDLVAFNQAKDAAGRNAAYARLSAFRRLVDAREKETSRQVAKVPWSAKARDAQRVPRKARERADVRDPLLHRARSARPPSWRSLASLRHGARSLLAMRGIASTRRRPRGPPPRVLSPVSNLRIRD